MEIDSTINKLVCAITQTNYIPPRRLMSQNEIDIRIKYNNSKIRKIIQNISRDDVQRINEIVKHIRKNKNSYMYNVYRAIIRKKMKIELYHYILKLYILVHNTIILRYSMLRNISYEDIEYD